VVNGESYRIEMGEGDWTSSDGWTDYADYRVKFLRRIVSGDSVEEYVYTKGSPNERKVKKEKSILPVNRLTLKEDGRESSLSFEAQNGFLVADSGGIAAARENRTHHGWR